MENRLISRRTVLTAAGLAVPAGVLAAASRSAASAEPNVTVDFTRVLARIDPLGVGIVISTYGKGPAGINSGGAWQAALRTLAPGHCRVPLRWNRGNPGSSAGGAQSSGDADTYIRSIRAIGAVPLVTFGGDSTDNGFTPSDGGLFVHHYNDSGGQNGGPVKYWTVGNEPGDLTGFQAAMDSMHAADPSVILSVPSASFWNQSLLQQAAALNGVGILSYHAYNGGDGTPDGFPNEQAYYDNVNQMRSWKPGVLYGVEEFNWHFAPGSTAFFDWRNTCFVADVIGEVLSAGGHPTFYSDANGPLGLMNDGGGQGQPGTLGTKLPAYWGVGIWTGLRNFRRYGTAMVHTATTFPSATLTVYASNTGKIIIVNKDPSSAHTVVISMKGHVTGRYWADQTQHDNPTGPIVNTAAGVPYSGGIITRTVPAGTVVSINV